MNFHRGILAGILAVLTMTARAGEGPPPPFSRLDLGDLSPETQLAVRRIVVSTAARFESLLKVSVGWIPIQVRFVPERTLEVKDLESIGGLQGMCRTGNGSAEIVIAARGSLSVSAVLAHETTHAWVAEAFGVASNTMLNEGLAQYLAVYAQPGLRNELRHAWLNGGVGVFGSPYVAGFHWVEEHAEDPRFPAFFRREIGREAAGIEELDRRWQEFGKE